MSQGFSAEKPQGYEQITDLTVSTAGVQDTDNIKGVTLRMIQAEGAAIRWRDDGIAPTTTTGLILEPGFVFQYTSGSSNLRFIASEPPEDAGFAISTNFDVANANAFTVTIDGKAVEITAATVCDTGTAKTNAADQWAAMLITADSAGALTGTFTADAATEAAAKILLSALAIPSGGYVVGYITVQTDSGNTWTAGTDALEGGTGGNPSDDTNYFNYRTSKVNISFYGTTSVA